MPQSKKFVATEILLFDFELFIGDLFPFIPKRKIFGAKTDPTLAGWLFSRVLHIDRAGGYDKPSELVKRGG